MKKIISTTLGGLLFFSAGSFAEDYSKQYGGHQGGTNTGQHQGQYQGTGQHQGQTGQPVQGDHRHGKPELGKPPGDAHAAWTPEKCQSFVPKLRKLGEKCNKNTQPDRRQACFQKAEGSLPRDFFEHCQNVADQVKAELEAQAHQKYAQNPGEQPPGVREGKGHERGEHRGGHHGKEQVDRWPADKCQKFGPKLRQVADGCLKVKSPDGRKACFDKIERSLPNGFFEQCREVAEPIRTEMEAKEKQLYPEQAQHMSH